jgi:hypothetical protein
MLFISPFIACKKALIEHTQDPAPAIPWTDSSTTHPLNAAIERSAGKISLKRFARHFFTGE